jgi:hypothetical protein
MSINPNVSTEQSNKASVRSNVRAGFSTVFEPTDVAVDVNAFFAATGSGVLRLAVTDATSTFTISGTSTGSVTSTLSGASSKVNDLVNALNAGPLAGVNFFVNAGGANYLKNTTVDVFIPAGSVALQVVSGTGTTPTLTAVALSNENVTYPNYVGTPNATPTWVDDVTVHAYPVYGVGAVVQDTTKTVQVQARQIQTRPLETQQYDGYFATYSGNLYQTAQKNTKRQQA